MSSGKKTRDHEFIRKWAEERGGHPTTVRDTDDKGEAGILRLDFDPPDTELERIGWDEFFRKFDEADLTFLYQEKTDAGKPSRFHKFIRG
jgi:hypothetical protein